MDGTGWSAWYPWGTEKIQLVPKGTAFLCTVSFRGKLSLHAANVIHGRHHSLLQFICRTVPGEYLLSLEMLCIFSLLANGFETKAVFCFAHLKWETIFLVKQGVGGSLSGGQNLLLPRCGTGCMSVP